MEVGSTALDDSSQKAIEGDLLDTGNKLLALPSSTDELLIHLEKAENLLARVWQQPPMSTRRALLPIMKALLMEDIVHHTDVNIQVAVASCFNELSRISAPEFPYPEDHMLVFFQLFMIAFQKLPSKCGCNYSRALKIIETMAKVRSSLMLLDIDTDGLIVKMFQLFLNNARSNFPFDTVKHMEMIMSLVLEESDEISFELLRPLLASVKMENKITSPLSWELGKSILENCSTNVRPYLKEAVKALRLDIDDYAEIVTSLCHDPSIGENMVLSIVAPTAGDRASQLDKLSETVHENCSPLTNGDRGNKLDDETSIDTSKGSQQTAKSGTDLGTLQRKRGRKPNSVISPAEGHVHIWTAAGKYSGEISSDGYNQRTKYLALPSEQRKRSMLSSSSEKKNDSFNDVSLRKRGQSKKKETIIDDQNDLGKLKRKVTQTKGKEISYNASNKAGKKAVSGSSTVRVKEEEIGTGTDTQGKHELFPPEQYGRKEIMERTISQKDLWKVFEDEMEVLPTSKPVKTKYPREEKEEKSRRSRVDYGEELVNLRIQVWWPMDETFYAGTVKYFDPVKKKHTVLRYFLFLLYIFLILYDDGEIEVLNLKKERWELFPDEPPRQKREADCPSLVTENLKTQQTKTKRKAGTSKKQHATSSSKRSRSESTSLIISAENSALDIFRVTDEPNNQTGGPNVSQKDVGENRAGKQESVALMTKIETGPHIS